jgi:hypothetical protein
MVETGELSDPVVRKFIETVNAPGSKRRAHADDGPGCDTPRDRQGRAFGLGADQRGLGRPFDAPTIPGATAPGADGSDIGAVELQASEVPPAPAAPSAAKKKCKKKKKHKRSAESAKKKHKKCKGKKKKK